MVPSRAMSEVMASPVTGPAVGTCTSPIAKARNSGSQAHQADRPVPAWGLRCGGIPARASLENPVARSWPSQNTAGQDRGTCPAADSRGAGRGGRGADADRLAGRQQPVHGDGQALLVLGEVAGDGGQPPCVHVTGLIARRLGEVEARLAELTRARDQLAALAERAAEQDPADCFAYCSIITG